MFVAIRTLSRSDFRQPVMISYLQRRAANILGTFAPFALAPTGYVPGYQTVKSGTRNDVEFFSNLAADRLASLRSP